MLVEREECLFPTTVYVVSGGSGGGWSFAVARPLQSLQCAAREAASGIIRRSEAVVVGVRSTAQSSGATGEVRGVRGILV